MKNYHVIHGFETEASSPLPFRYTYYTSPVQRVEQLLVLHPVLSKSSLIVFVSQLTQNTI
jgi:hypothetical protein